MFNGDIQKVIDYCEKIGATYSVEKQADTMLVYIVDKKVAELKKKHPQKYRREYLSYLRVSKHADHNWFYTRQDGLVGYKNDRWIKDQIDYLTNGESA